MTFIGNESWDFCDICGRHYFPPNNLGMCQVCFYDDDLENGLVDEQEEGGES